jgi:hypothetical protein
LGDWLISEFSLFGIHFQNWMLLFVIVILAALPCTWWYSKR